MTEHTKIFNIGFPKTGTTSLERALEILGYNVCKGNWRNHYTNYLLALCVNEDFDEIINISRQFDAFSDAPWGESQLYKKLVEVYPDAYYIMTYRDPDEWYDSFERLFTKLDDNLTTAMDTFYRNGRFAVVYYHKHFFNINQLAGNREKIIDQYKRHNDNILEYFEQHDYKFKSINLTQYEGNEWHELCSFLGKKIPAQPFPHLNPGKKAGGSVYNPSLKEKSKYKLKQLIDKL